MRVLTRLQEQFGEDLFLSSRQVVAAILTLVRRIQKNEQEIIRLQGVLSSLPSEVPDTGTQGADQGVSEADVRTDKCVGVHGKQRRRRKK